MIKHIPLKHGWYYFYRIHQTKTNELTTNGLSKLREYMEFVAENCPNEYFNIGPRSSSLKFKLNDVKLHSIEGHEISKLAKQGYKNSTTAHNDVEMFLLENDDKTIAVEVPLWIKSNELSCFKELFKSKDPLTGHIDVLRVEDGKIWIWDYKPNAKDEKFATTQTFFYAYMLSKRTNIPIENFRCGYFDQHIAYVFKPQLEMIPQISLLQKFIKPSTL